MTLYITAARRATMFEEGERLKLLRTAVWGDEKAFSEALSNIIKE